MYLFNYIFMCLYIGVYVFYQWAEMPMPAWLPKVNVGVNWGFLLWGIYSSGRIVVDCILSRFKNEMSPANTLNGILLAVLDFLPVLLMSGFMLREGFASR